MRRLTVVPITFLLSALAVPFAGTASAAACLAVAVPPHFVPWRSRIEGAGSFRCDQPAAGMTITVCVEEDLGSQGWWQRGCETVTAEGEAETVSAKVAVDVMVYSTFLRTTVVASNANGDTAQVESPPVFWFNCACYIG